MNKILYSYKKKFFFNQICSDKNYNLKRQTRITEVKLMGVCPGTFHSNLQPKTTTCSEVLFP